MDVAQNNKILVSHVSVFGLNVFLCMSVFL